MDRKHEKVLEEILKNNSKGLTSLKYISLSDNKLSVECDVLSPVQSEWFVVVGQHLHKQRFRQESFKGNN